MTNNIETTEEYLVKENRRLRYLLHKAAEGFDMIAIALEDGDVPLASAIATNINIEPPPQETVIL